MRLLGIALVILSLAGCPAPFPDDDPDGGVVRTDAGAEDAGAKDAGDNTDGGGGGGDGGTEDGGVDPGDGGTREPRIPTLRPLSQAQATVLGAYARRLKVASTDGSDIPIAWSLINMECTDRAQAVSWALATADANALGSPPPPLRASSLTDEMVQQATTAPTFDSARIWVYGPLVTTQTLVRPSNATVRSDDQYWPYHVATVVNVEGQLQVLDLSVGDAPLPIHEWLKAFVAPGTDCALSDEDDDLPQWIYWMQASGGVPGYQKGQQVPSPPCTYHFTPLFQGRWDLPTLSRDDALGLISTHYNQTQIMRQMLSGTGIPDEELPMLLSRYEPRTIEWMCDQFGRAMNYPVCQEYP